jgi:hypothetical protein
MRNILRKARISFVTLLFVTVIAISYAFAGPKTYTGQVGDAMCGNKHLMNGSAECTRICAQHGSKYALLIKDKVYILDTKDKIILGQLNDLAGRMASVKGTTNGNTIEVSSAKAAK